MSRKLRNFIFVSVIFFADFSRVCADPVSAAGKEPAGMGNDILPIILFSLVIIIWLVQLIARGLMLEKRTGNGWQILVPFYGRYLEYKNYWKVRYFWANTVLWAYLFVSSIIISQSENESVNFVLALVFLAAMAAAVIIRTGFRMHTVELFGFNKNLGMLEIAGLGFIPDFLCGFSKRGRLKDKAGADRERQDENERRQLLEEKFENWE